MGALGIRVVFETDAVAGGCGSPGIRLALGVVGYVLVASGSLLLKGDITYRGATIAGNGTLRQFGNAVVESDTTISTDIFDWDGPDINFYQTTINSGVRLTIASDQIDTNPGDGFDSTVTLDSGSLQVLTDWRMDGQMNLNNTGGGTPTVSGWAMLKVS